MATQLPQPIQFGKYTLFERIGRGGMADVFKGRVQGPAGFERVFVVKRILPHLSDDPTFNTMFVEEAKMSARLSHPNIVQVFELGSVEGEYFISMEHVRGRDLAETMRVLWARIGPPRPELVAYIGREMCRALAYAHNLSDDAGRALGMIHRDVSPSNVMLSYEGAVKLLDFGIAKALGDAKKEENARTGTGALKGKFAYMAPEQTEGEDVDHRIDIFAAGIVLHEVLTGRRLFKGANDLQTIERVRLCAVDPPSAQNPLCPPELDAVVSRALARNRDNRFQSAMEMAEALDDVVHAARFQPEHLAQLMRELFPTDAGPSPLDGHRPPTGSRPSGSVSTSASASASRTPRSPTIAPVSLSRSTTASRGLAGPDPAMLALPRRAGWKRWAVAVTAGAVFLSGIAFAVVNFRRPPARPRAVMRSGSPAQTRAVRPASGMVKVSVQSIPEGADVFLEGQAKPIAKTPGSFPVPWDEHIQTRIIIRKAGFSDHIEKILPSQDLPIIAGLKPLRAPPPPVPPAGIEGAEVEAERTSEGSPSSSSPRRRRSSNKIGDGALINPF